MDCLLRASNYHFRGANSMIFRTVLLTLMLTITSLSFAWDDSIHKIINYIAYQNLSDQTRAQVDSLIEPFIEQNPGYDDFIDIGTWADDLKRIQHVSTFNLWHFVRIPYYSEGGLNTDIVLDEIPQPNIIWAIADNLKTLKASGQLPVDNAYTKAWFLVLLTHWVADIHQPLHTHDLHNKDFPQGSRNGNDIAIEEATARNNLHLYWDFGLNKFREEYASYPLSKQDVKKAGDKLMARYPQTMLNDSSDPAQWAVNNLKPAAFAYAIEPGSKPSKGYIYQGRDIVSKQIVLAGMRLAHALNSIFDKTIEE